MAIHRSCWSPSSAYKSGRSFCFPFFLPLLFQLVLHFKDGKKSVCFCSFLQGENTYLLLGGVIHYISLLPMSWSKRYPGGGRSSKSATLPSGVLLPVFLPLLTEAASSRSVASEPAKALLRSLHATLQAFKAAEKISARLVIPSDLLYCNLLLWRPIRLLSLA